MNYQECRSIIGLSQFLKTFFVSKMLAGSRARAVRVADRRLHGRPEEVALRGHRGRILAVDARPEPRVHRYFFGALREGGAARVVGSRGWRTDESLDNNW